MPAQSLLATITDGSIPPYEALAAYNIYTATYDLPMPVMGFTYVTKRQHYYIIINDNLCHEMQQKVLAHELKHTIYDLPKIGYIIGLDMQHTPLEKDADGFYKTIIKLMEGEK